MKPKALLLPISILIALIFAVLPTLTVMPVNAGDSALQSDETPTPVTDIVEKTDISPSPTAHFADTEEPLPPTPVYEETATPALPTSQWTETVTPTAFTPTPTSTLADPTATSLPVSNLLVNGSFEEGISGWEQLKPQQIVAGDTHSGEFAVQIGSNQEMRQGWVKVTPGIPYLLMVWMKWSEFEGTNWGYTRLRIVDTRWSRIAERKHMQREIQQNQWGQVVLEFTPESDRILISAGVFGPQDKADLLFDDFTLAPKPVEPPPVTSASLKITAPTMSGAYETSESSIIVGGIANSAVRLVWDNIDTDTAGLVSGDAPIKDWKTNKINLKPGRNELLFTAQNAEGQWETARLIVNRTISGPAISAVNLSANQIPVYEKVEVRFQLATAAQNYFYAFDTNPPPGVSPGLGVTAEGVFTSPSGQILVQPAFYMIDAVRTASSGLGHFQQTNNSYWAVRFSPREEGQYTVSIRVQDASGQHEVQAGSFTASRPNRPGYIQVSKADTRYFEFSSGQLFWPIGPVDGSDYGKYKDTGMNMQRPWMAGLGAYSSNFARWMSSAKTLGNEGFDSQLSFAEHYPGHEISQEIFYPEGRRIWIGWNSGERYAPRLKMGATYQVKARLKTKEMSGPADPAVPHGFMVKMGGWPSDTIERDLRSKQDLIPRVSQNSDWFTVVTHTTITTQPGPYLFLYLDNVSAGKVYIDQFSIREVLSGGSLGGELVVNSKAALHTYVEPAAAAAIDYQVSQAEANGVYLKYVVYDKRDWIPNHLTADGIFAENGNGFYQADGTRAMWLQKQWWRYLAARWGYSTAIHSWELNNEGSPDDVRHYETAQRFARFMHTIDSHPHLATTSFWCCWRPNFWGDRQKYPDIDYADLHEYISDPNAAYDLTKWSVQSSLSMFGSNVGKPIMMGESGIGSPGSEFFGLLEKPNGGDWYHDLLWSQLNPGAVSHPNYWWSQHLKVIDAAAISKAFTLFIQDLDLNKGGYQDASPVINNNVIGAVGQKNLPLDRAHLWVFHNHHTWSNLAGVNGGQAPGGESATLQVQMNPNVQYQIQWWDTITGQVFETTTAAADGTGLLSLSFSELRSDVAIKIFK